MKHNGMEFDNYFDLYPNAEGYFGPYGGVYVPDGFQDVPKSIQDEIIKSRAK